MGYQPRLDGLRALAIAGVFVEHFVTNETIRGMSLGGLGVRLFFVLSGFLITSKLLEYRTSKIPLLSSAKDFFWRRALRLTPAYYTAIALAFSLNLLETREFWWVYALYLTNFQVAIADAWIGASHFWTLAVEEQFYLVWFFVIVLLPRRWLPFVFLAAILMGPAFRSSFAFGVSTFNAVLLPGQIDSLALGALIAFARSAPGSNWFDRLIQSRTLLLISLVIVLIGIAPIEWPFTERKRILVGWAIFPVFVNLAAACAVRQALGQGAGGLDLLSWPIVRHIGRISYGLYVYHYFIPPLVLPAFPMLAEPGADFLKFLVFSALSLIVAQVSWLVVERPALSLKPGPAVPRVAGERSSKRLDEAVARLRTH